MEERTAHKPTACATSASGRDIGAQVFVPILCRVAGLGNFKIKERYTLPAAGRCIAGGITLIVAAWDLCGRLCLLSGNFARQVADHHPKTHVLHC